MRLFFSSRSLICASIILVAAACSGNNGEADAAPTDPATAKTCGELADVFLAVNQEFLHELGNTPAEDFAALMQPLYEEQETLPPPVAKLKASSDVLRVRMDELACTDEELQRLAFSRADRLDAGGPAGELWISILLEQEDRADE